MVEDAPNLFTKFMQMPKAEADDWRARNHFAFLLVVWEYHIRNTDEIQQGWIDLLKAVLQDYSTEALRTLLGIESANVAESTALTWVFSGEPEERRGWAEVIIYEVLEQLSSPEELKDFFYLDLRNSGSFDCFATSRLSIHPCFISFHAKFALRGLSSSVYVWWDQIDSKQPSDFSNQLQTRWRAMAPFVKRVEFKTTRADERSVQQMWQDLEAIFGPIDASEMVVLLDRDYRVSRRHPEANSLWRGNRYRDSSSQTLMQLIQSELYDSALGQVGFLSDIRRECVGDDPVSMCRLAAKYGLRDCFSAAFRALTEEQTKNETLSELLADAAERGNTDIVRIILSKMGTGASCRTAATLAAFNGHVTVVRLFQEHDSVFVQDLLPRARMKYEQRRLNTNDTSGMVAAMDQALAAFVKTGDLKVLLPVAARYGQDSLKYWILARTGQYCSDEDLWTAIEPEEDECFEDDSAVDDLDETVSMNSDKQSAKLMEVPPVETYGPHRLPIASGEGRYGGDKDSMHPEAICDNSAGEDNGRTGLLSEIDKVQTINSRDEAGATGPTVESGKASKAHKPLRRNPGRAAKARKPAVTFERSS